MKQGSVISPLLFSILFGAIVEEVEKRTKGLGLKLMFKIGGDIFDISSIKKKKDKDLTIVEIWNMLLTDDAELCSDSKENLQSIVNIFNEVVSAFGQEISCKKTEVMVTDTKNEKKCNASISVDNYEFNVVTKFRYLGVIENSESNMKNELAQRIFKTRSNFLKYKVAVLNNRDLNYKITLSNYKVLILSTLLYACETWVISGDEMKTLEILQKEFLKKIFRVKDYMNKVSYLDLLMLASKYDSEILPIEIIVRKRRLMFFGKVSSMDENRLCYILMHSDTVDGARPRGPCFGGNYRSTIKKDLEEFSIHSECWKDRKIVEEVPWSKLIEKRTDSAFKKWCLHGMSETIYGTNDITKLGREIKANTLDELKRKRIFIEVDKNRGRGSKRFHSCTELFD